MGCFQDRDTQCLGQNLPIFPFEHFRENVSVEQRLIHTLRSIAGQLGSGLSDLVDGLNFFVAEAVVDGGPVLKRVGRLSGARSNAGGFDHTDEDLVLLGQLLTDQALEGTSIGNVKVGHIPDDFFHGILGCRMPTTAHLADR